MLARSLTVAVLLAGLALVGDATASATTFAERARPATTPPCFGAAARDPETPCVNDRLNFTAIPSPFDAHSSPALRARRSSRLLRRCAPSESQSNARPSTVA